MANIPISSFTAAANATGIGMSGFSLTGSNAQSMLDLAGTWNTSGTPTGIKLNVTDTASNAASLLMDLQVGGVSRLNVDKNGRALSPLNSNSIPALATSAASDRGFGFYANRPSVLYGTNVAWSWPDAQTMSLGSTSRIAWTSGNPIDATGDLFILRDAANTLAQRNGVNAQTLRIYNTFTDASNYERGIFDWASTPNSLTIGTQQAGTGTARSLRLTTQGDANLLFITNSVTRLDVSSLGLRATANLIWTTDNAFDIGQNAANRPRDIFSSRDVYAQSNTSGFYLGSVSDVALLRDDANILAQRRSTNPQTLRVYNTSTDASNYERLSIGWSANAITVGAEAAGTGIQRNLFIGGLQTILRSSNVNRWQIDVNGHFTASADNTYDIGASGANRPRSIFTSAGVVFANSLAVNSSTYHSVLWNAGQYGWASSGTVTTSSAIDTGLSRVAAGIIGVTNGSTGGGAMQMTEITAPAAPATNEVRIYAEDNGSGKTRLMARFATGAAVQIAIEP